MANSSAPTCFTHPEETEQILQISESQDAQKYGSVHQERKTHVRHAGLTLMLLQAMAAIEGMDQTLLPASMRALEVELGFSPTSLSRLASVQGLAQALSGPVWGSLADNGFSRKRLLVTGTMMWATLTAMMGLCSHFSALLILRVFNGFALGMLTPVVQAVVSQEAPPEQHGWEFGCLSFAMNFGCIISSLVITSISSKIFHSIYGWRFGFMAVAAFSVCMAMLVQRFMHEHPRKSSLENVGFFVELKKFISYLRISTFQVIVLQGIVGCIPWASMPFTTLYLQYLGLSDLSSGMVVALGMMGIACGNLLGGSIGDRLAAWSPCHGRAMTAQISVFLGTTMAAIFFLTFPLEGSRSWSLGIVFFFFGLVCSWCGAGCNQPIFVQIVPASSRASALAWDKVLETGISSVVGPSALSFLMQHVFSYKPSRALISSMSPEARRQNAHALGTSLALCHIVPWSLCFIVYGLLHVTYKRDVQQQCPDEATQC